MAGTIFISYRRDDDPGYTGRLIDRLYDAFQPDQLFMDVDSIKPGLDFVSVIEEQVSQCDILLAVMGQNWADIQDKSGNRRLDSSDDFVRMEIESALSQNKLVIPILVGDARMPRLDELPETLKPLLRRHAVRLTRERFRIDAQDLVKTLKDALEKFEADRRAQAEAVRKAQEAEAKRRAEEERLRADAAAREQADKQLTAEQRARQEMAQLLGRNAANLSPEQVARVEELQRWDSIKDSLRPQDFHDHLARFPRGVCADLARRRLETIEEEAYRRAIGKTKLEAFLNDFPRSRHIGDVKRRLAVQQGGSAEAQPRSSASPRRRTILVGAVVLLVGLSAMFAVLRGVNVGTGTDFSGQNVCHYWSLWGTHSTNSDTCHLFTPDRARQLAESLIQDRRRPGLSPAPIVSTTPTTTASGDCPVPSDGRASLDLRGGFEPDPVERKVTAGGSFSIAKCTSASIGYVDPKADLVLNYQGSDSIEWLAFEVNSRADTTLLINDPQGAWRFDDDGAGNRNPRVSFQKPRAGVYHIWVGTVGSENAESKLIITERWRP